MRPPAMPPSSLSISFWMFWRNMTLKGPPACTRWGFCVSSARILSLLGGEVRLDLVGRDVHELRLAGRWNEHELDGAAAALLVDRDARERLGREARLQIDGQAEAGQQRLCARREVRRAEA